MPDTLHSPALPDALPFQALPEALTDGSKALQYDATLRKRRRKRLLRMIRPGRNSLYDLMHEHAGQSLFVRPICWTSQHVSLLHASFHETPRCDSPQPHTSSDSPSRGIRPISSTIRTLSDGLTEILEDNVRFPTITTNAIRRVLHVLWPATFRNPSVLPELHLYFGDRVYRDMVRTQLMWNYQDDSPATTPYTSFHSLSTRSLDSFPSTTANSTPPSSSHTGQPMICYLSKDQLAASRQNMYRVSVGPGRSVNEPVSRLQRMRSKSLVPSDPNQDPLFIGIFLAMAQRHFYPRPSTNTSRRFPGWSCQYDRNARSELHDLRLRFLTHDSETAEFIVYTGYMSAAFLRRFDRPFAAPEMLEEGKVPGLRVEYTRVPIWPILGLRERMGKALGEELVGPFEATTMTTWNEEEEGDAEERPRLPKRKREALSEVVNASFGSDSDSDDEPALSAKKRCLKEGTPIGVVV